MLNVIEGAMMRGSLKLLFLILFLVAGCGHKLTNDQKTQATKCIKKIDEAIKWLEQRGYDKDIDGEPKTVKEEDHHIFYGRFVSLRSIKSDLLFGIEKNRLSDNDYVRVFASLGQEKACGPYSNDYESVRVDNPHYPRPIREAEERRSLESMNAEIDRAQEKILSDYRRKAAEHRVSGGPGPRVDQFVMRDGSVIHCVTSIRGAGKAVSCR